MFHLLEAQNVPIGQTWYREGWVRRRMEFVYNSEPFDYKVTVKQGIIDNANKTYIEAQVWLASSELEEKPEGEESSYNLVVAVLKAVKAYIDRFDAEHGQKPSPK